MDAATGGRRATFSVHHGEVRALAFGQLSDGTTILATGGYDESSLRSAPGKLLGETVWTYSYDHNPHVLLWDVAAGGCRARLTGHTNGGVSAIAFGRTPENRPILATGGYDIEEGERLGYPAYLGGPAHVGGDVRLWDLDDMTLLGTLPGQPGGVTTLAFGSFADGSPVLAVAGGFPDCAVNIWDPFTRRTARLPHRPHSARPGSRFRRAGGRDGRPRDRWL